MKITHICLAGPVTDGWNYQDNMLTKFHKRIGYEVSIITSQWVWGTDGKLIKDTNDKYVNEYGVFVRRLPLKGKDDFNKKLKAFYGLMEALEIENPDILFIHNVQHMDMPKIVRYLKKHKTIKVFVDSHTDFSNSATNWLSKNILHGILWKHMAHLIAPYVEKFYGVLPARVDFLVNVYGLPQNKVELLVMAADDDEIEKYQYADVRHDFVQEYNIDEKDFLIVTGGKIDEAKTQTLLLMEAVKKLGNPKIKLLVFGSVADALKLQFNALVDGKQIQYVGWLHAMQTYRYFAAADLVVFPGRHSVFWEQVVGQGIPMVCKYWEGTTHVNTHDNVIFIKRDTVEELQQVLDSICFNQLKYERMKNNAILARSEFRYGEIAKKSIQQV